MHSSPATPPSPSAAAAPSARRDTRAARPRDLAGLVFIACTGFLLVALNGIVDPGAIDVSLIPRLLAILLFLTVSVAAISVPAISRRLDFSILGEPVIPLFGGYLLITVGSLLVAVNVSAGFTDVFRTLATFLTLCLFCLLLPTVPRWREQLLGVIVIAGLAAVTVGGSEIVTRLGPGVHGRRAMEQITGLMSSVNLYAGMLCLLLPWCAGGMVILRGAWRGLAAVATIGAAAMILLLQSRAAWLAALAGAAVALATVLVDPARFGLSRRARTRLGAACVAGVVALVAGVTTAPAGNRFAERFRSIFVEPVGPAALPREGGRLMIWGITTRMIADHPLTGVGAGNFTVRLHEYFDDDDLDFSNVHTNWVQPHNDFLWVFVEKGLPGIALFAGCFVAAGIAIRTILRSDAAQTDRRLALVTLAGLAAYATLSCFDFPLERINHQVSFALLLAVPTVLKHGIRPASGGVPRHGAPPTARLAIAVLIIAALALGSGYSLAALQQEKDVIVARRAWRQGRWEEMLAAARRARTPWKTLDPLVSPVAFLEGFAQVQLGRVAEGIECLEQARADNPNRMYVVNNLGILYASTGRFDEAIECFSLAANRYAHRIEPFNNLAICLMETGRPAEAVELLEQIPAELRNDAVRGNLDLARTQAAAHATDPPSQ